jgi:hypothetical protein
LGPGTMPGSERLRSIKRIPSSSPSLAWAAPVTKSSVTGVNTPSPMGAAITGHAARRDALADRRSTCDIPRCWSIEPGVSGPVRKRVNHARRCGAASRRRGGAGSGWW